MSSIIANIFTICGKRAEVLIDLGSTHSIVTSAFIENLPIVARPLDCNPSN